MATANGVVTIEQAYAHALAIAQEAANRYYEFSQKLIEYHSESTSRMFSELAKMTAEVTQAIAGKAGGMTLPVLEAWRYSWIDAGPPDETARNMVFHMLTPYGALKIALSGEYGARTFFERVVEVSRDEDVRNFAREVVAQIEYRIKWLEHALRSAPRPFQYGEDFEAFLMR